MLLLLRTKRLISKEIEQLSLSVHYTDLDENKIREDILRFVSAVDLTGQVVANLIISNLKLRNIDCQVLIGQVYDAVPA